MLKWKMYKSKFKMNELSKEQLLALKLQLLMEAFQVVEKEK